jgi:hypothetical protein
MEELCCRDRMASGRLPEATPFRDLEQSIRLFCGVTVGLLRQVEV